MSAKEDLQKDLSEAEEAAFAEFVNKLGLKSIQEYEQSRDNNAVKTFNERKNQLNQTISNCEAEMQFIDGNNVNVKGMQAIEAILKQEEDKLESLMSDKFQSDMIQKL